MMQSRTWSDRLWGNNASVALLLVAATVMLLTWLGTREIWTQEHRWADIVAGMFYRHDFLHPYLGEVNYYDKPLLSYWLIAGLAYITGHFNAFVLRLPSALAGLLSIWSIYRLGTRLKNKNLGLLSGWMLLTTFYFLFWAKTSSADMLNLGGTLFAICWYFEKREQPGFFNYAIFFLIIALTSLCKGLIGAVVPFIILLPTLFTQGEWKQHLRVSFFLAMIPAAIVYALPFWASSHFGGENYGESGLYLVYRENVLRYFQPFDHKGPIYTYFLYLPIYLMPWAFFFVPALLSLKSRWKNVSPEMKSICWAVLLLFLFLTLSGSRRNYYVLPLVPFAILMTADWILAGAETAKRYVWAGKVAVGFFVILFLNFDVLQPLYYAQGGMEDFAAKMKTQLTITKTNKQQEYVMLDPESKVRFYMDLPPNVKDYEAIGNRQIQTQKSLLAAWPVLKDKKKNVIFISRKAYKPMLQKLLPNYTLVEATPSLGERVLHRENFNAPIAFIPVA